jgi:hypothetical protein
MSTSKEWHASPGLISDKLYRVRKEINGFIYLEVQHVPNESEWITTTTNDAPVLISHLRDLGERYGLASHLWTYMGGRGSSVRTLARLTDSATHYQISTDNEVTWKDTDHPYALARRILELDPA